MIWAFALALFWAVFASLGCVDLRMQRNCYRDLWRKGEASEVSVRAKLHRLNLAINKKGARSMSRIQLFPGASLETSCDRGVFWLEVEGSEGGESVLCRLADVDLVALAHWALNENHERVLREGRPIDHAL
jgi:hypothetical protein